MQKENTISLFYKEKLKNPDISKDELLNIANSWGMDGCEDWFPMLLNHPKTNKIVIEIALCALSRDDFFVRCYAGKILERFQSRYEELAKS